MTAIIEAGKVPKNMGTMNAQNSSGQNKQSKINIVLRSVFGLQKPHFGWWFMHIFVESVSNVVEFQGH